MFYHEDSVIDVDQAAQNLLSLVFRNFRIPLLVKYGVILNFNAIVASTIFIMALHGWHGLRFSPLVMQAANLIPFFSLGVFCALASLLLGVVSYIAQALPSMFAPHSFFYSKLVETNAVFWASFSLMILSVSVFCASLIYATRIGWLFYSAGIAA